MKQQFVATKTSACNWSAVLFDFIVRIHLKTTPGDIVSDIRKLWNQIKVKRKGLQKKQQ